MDALQRALVIDREIGDRQGEGADLSILGEVALRREQYEAATDTLRQALAIHREVGDRRLEARNLVTQGRVAAALDDLGSAETSYRSSLRLAAEHELGPEAAAAQLALGRLLAERLNRREERCPLILEAARRFGEMSMPEAAEAREAAERLGCGPATS